MFSNRSLNTPTDKEIASSQPTTERKQAENAQPLWRISRPAKQTNFADELF